MFKTNQITVLAVDGGGTCCRALLCDQTGAILGYAEAGSANFHSIGQEQTVETLTRLLKALAGRPITVDCAVFGLAGVDTAKDRSTIALLVQAGLSAAAIAAKNVVIENDGYITLAGAVGDRAGLLLIAGTGSIAWGASGDGRAVRVGGWGSRAGDEGSGFDIGMRAIRHILRAADGRENQSAICAAVLQEKGMIDVENLIDWLYSPNYSPDSVAALAPVICRLAQAGDAKAIAILSRAAKELALMALSVIRQLGLETSSFRVVLSGGVFQNNSFLCAEVIDQIKIVAQRAMLAPPLYQPIVGGAVAGLRACGITVNDALLLLNKGIEEAKSNV